MNYSDPPIPLDGYACDAREALGIKKEEYFFLQPTRFVRRKEIEDPIEFARRLARKDLKARFMISPSSGDEGDRYEMRLREYSEPMRVNTR